MMSIRERLQDMLDAIEKIQKYTPQNRSRFDEDELVHVWIVHHLQIIGEAVRFVTPTFRQRHPQVPWREIAGMRNILVHDYGRVNLTIVWETVTTQIPTLKEAIQAILSQLPAADATGPD